MTRVKRRGAAVLALALMAAPAAAQQSGQTGSTQDAQTGGATSGSVGGTAATQTGTGAGQVGAAATGASGTAGLTGTAEANDFARGEVLTLEQCMQAALAGSRDLLLARQRLALAQADVGSGWSVVRPQISVGATLTRNDKEVTIPFENPDTGETQVRVVQDLWQWNATGRASQLLFDGRAIPTLYALYAVRDAAELSNERLQTEVLFSVASSFYGVLALEEAVQVARRQVEDTGEHLEATRARYEVGELSKVDLLRAQIDRTTAEEDLVASEAALAGAKIRLAVLIGRPDDAGDFRLERPPTPELAMDAPDAAVERAIRSRPDLEAAQRQIDAAGHQVTASRLAFLPTLGVSWQGNYSPVTGFFREDEFSWQAFLNLTWNLLDGGSRFVEMQRANVRRRQAELQAGGLQDSIRREVLQSRLDLQTARSNLQKAQAAAELAVENAGLIQARFEAGLATSLDVTDATARRFQSEVEVVRQRLNLELAVLGLARAMGVLDEATPIPESP